MRKTTKKILSLTQQQFQSFAQTLTASGNIVITSAILSLLLANSMWSDSFANIWHHTVNIGGLHFTTESFINDALMSFFFLLVGLEIKRELLIGSLSDFKTAAVPFAAAIGGMVFPALIFMLFNIGKASASGWAIPMATDIAFALAVLQLIKHRVNKNLIVLLTTLAVVDDLGAVLVIAVFYTAQLNYTALIAAGGILVLLFVLNKGDIKTLWVYLTAGLFLWITVAMSGVHATVAGVLLAFFIPLDEENEHSSFQQLTHFLERPVNYFVLPLFAFCNTAIHIQPEYITEIGSPLALGIILGLVFGKTIGIFLFSYLSVKMKWGKLPERVTWHQIMGMAILGGIGFTMSIFVTLLAFTDNTLIEQSKLYIVIGSCISSIVGIAWLLFTSNQAENKLTS
jgi:NhaA family Na+:H+ antiporter